MFVRICPARARPGKKNFFCVFFFLGFFSWVKFKTSYKFYRIIISKLCVHSSQMLCEIRFFFDVMHVCPACVRPDRDADHFFVKSGGTRNLAPNCDQLLI